MKKNYAVITGASSGLGAEFARQLTREGYSVVLVARREDRLKQLSEELRVIHKNSLAQGEEMPDIRIVTEDLSSPEGCRALMEKIAEIPIGIFINNAGFGDCGRFTETDVEKELSMIDVNVKALHLLTKLALKRFEEQKGGYLLNVASSAGLIPAGPYMATYYATKAYAASLTRGIARELKEAHSPIYIGALCPGPVDTEFNSVANVEFALPGITAEYCVREAIRGMKKRKTVIVPSTRMKLATGFGRHLPESIYIAAAGHQQKKKLGGD